jgi:hypothetical protein
MKIQSSNVNVTLVMRSGNLSTVAQILKKNFILSITALWSRLSTKLQKIYKTRHEWLTKGNTIFYEHKKELYMFSRDSSNLPIRGSLQIKILQDLTKIANELKW